jgi:hypothetical protein
MKIAAIEINKDGSAKIAPADDGYSIIETALGFKERFKGFDADLGYYVKYADGYESWSPTKAFEEGYTQV